MSTRVTMRKYITIIMEASASNSPNEDDENHDYGDDYDYDDADEDYDDADDDHRRALRDTGFWGAQGAGCIFIACSTGRILLAHRSRHVLEPDTWGSWGGAIDRNERPETAVKREIEEETGYDGEFDLIPLMTFHKGTFAYHNFLAIVPDEFEPDINWEQQGFRWCEWGNWPSPIHFGLKALLSDKDSTDMIQSTIRKYRRVR